MQCISGGRQLQPLDLPEPSAELKAQSQALVDLIHTEIGDDSISFRRFMELALYAPDLGYYTSGTPKIGVGGDFTTAPQISPLFGQCLAYSLADQMNALGESIVLELGAGLGTLAISVLEQLKALNSLPKEYWILEVSADLKAQQKQAIAEALPDFIDRVHWLNELPTAPVDNLLIIANEVLDAMPIHRIQKTEEGLQEAHVTWNFSENHFDYALKPLDDTLQQACAYLTPEKWPTPYSTEINLNIEPWLKTLSNAMTKGTLIFSDYGYAQAEYYHPQRDMGTLRCYFQHLTHDDPLILAGIQDITAHVDFSAVANSAQSLGLDLAGFTTQAHFLMQSGLPELCIQPAESLEAQLKLAQAIKTLTMPDEMGEVFKFIALRKGHENPVLGFEPRNLNHQLG